MATEKRLIDANALLEAYWEEQKKPGTYSIAKIIMNATIIDAVEVVHGWWIHDINNLYGCSECGERETMSPKKLKNYCPNCGAKMDGERKDNDI